MTETEKRIEKIEEFYKNIEKWWDNCDMIHHIDKINLLFQGTKPYDVLKCGFKGNFSPYHNFFYLDDSSNIVTISDSTTDKKIEDIERQIATTLKKSKTVAEK